MPAARVCAVYDADSARAEHVAAAADAVAVGSAEELIDSADVDAVVIASPDPRHAEQVLACIAAETPVLCEKPLATDIAGSRQIVAAEAAFAERTGRRLVQVGFMRRYDPAFVALRAHVATGAIGTPRVVHCVHRNAASHPTATTEGIVVNSMIHELDHVPWLLDDPVTAITVRVARDTSDGSLGDPQVAVLELASGVLATVEVFVNARYGYDVQCEVVGDDGTAGLTPPYGIAVRSPAAASGGCPACRCRATSCTGSPTPTGSSSPTGSPPRCAARSTVRVPATATGPTWSPPPAWSRCAPAGGSRSPPTEPGRRLTLRWLWRPGCHDIGCRLRLPPERMS